MRPRRPTPRLVAALAVGLALPAAAAPAASAAVDVYPIPGTKVANPATTISFRGSAQIKGLIVKGEQSGTHSGHFVEHSDGKGVSFVPDRRFRESEVVTVHATTRLARASSAGNVRFRIYTRPNPKDVRNIDKAHKDPGGDPEGVQRFHSRKDLRPPNLVITTSTGRASDDPIFYAVKAGPGQDGPTIRDAQGRLIWFHRTSADVSPYDFRAQVYRGRPVLTWWEGAVLAGKGRGHGVILDSSYRLLKTVTAGNGYSMDQHEFQLTPRGTAFINVYEPVKYSLKPAGGSKDGAAWDSIVQEIDLKTGMVVFEWHSLAHVSVSLGTFPLREDSGLPYDPFHVNSVSEDGAGNLLLSARNTNALFLVSRHDGHLLARIGGKRSDYTMGPGTPMIGQHQAILQPNGTISVFDNGGSTHYPTVPDRPSRGIVIRLDAPTQSVSLVREYLHPGQNLFSRSQGSMQVLPSGNVFIGWGGGNPNLTELTEDGQLAMESHIDPPNDDTYRAYRLPWRAVPAAPPDVIASTSQTGTDVYASWNGATEVARWQVLAGDDPANLEPAGKFDRTDFETRIRLPGAPKYVAVRALDAAGGVLGTSQTVQPKTV